LTRTSTEGSSGNDEINVNSVEGQPLSLDVSMSFKLEPGKVPALYSTFRTDIAAIQHSCVKQAIRQSLQEVVGNEEIAAIIGPKKFRGHFPGEPAAGGAALALRHHREAVTINELRALPSVIEAISITPTLVQHEMSKRWNGQMLQVTGGAMPMIQLPTK
jgi:hypothetical protein